MTTPFEASIVRLRTAEGSIVGTGFLVDEGHVLTCAHVVADALGIPRDAEEKPISTLHLDFPLIAPDDIRTAHVTLWQSGDDIAGLELEGDPPAAARPVRLVTAQDLWLHPFRAFGFPTGYDDGVWASGVLRGRQATGWVQIEDVKEPGYWVQPGFSGTLVWDEQLNGVVGMAVAADTQREIKAAFMIPAHLLIEAWPELALRSLDVNDLVYLEEQLAVLETVQQNAPDPRRFQPRIDELRAAISNWEGRVEQQRQRIAEGLEEQRQQIVESTQRRDEKHLRVIGRRPLDVTDYFKDRQRELMSIGELLAQPTTRLASVIGHGGMGKTALVCKVLRDLERHRWPHTDDEIPLDGIVYLSTRTTGISLERLFLDCAKLLGGAEEKRLNAIWTNSEISTEDKVLHLLKALSGGRYIILLDNIEDLLDDQGQLLDESLRLFFEQGLTTSHGARLLVTSRIALAFRREVMRFDRQVKLLEGLPTEDGVALLRELDPNGEYGLRDAPEEELAQAVSLVHGVPRALEVLAGILANDPFASLAEALGGFYEHEDVVQALIEENYRRLDGNARRVIEALAVFRRPVPPLAVDYLLEPFAPGLDVPGIIRRLVGTNTVSVDRATKTVTLHPIDQDYAYSQLPEEGAEEIAYTRQALERRAADYYVQLRSPSETWKTIDDLEPQLAEFEHRVRAGDYDDACRVLDSIDFDYLHMWGYYAKLVEMRRSILGGLKDPGLRAATLRSLGDIYRATGPFEHAVKLYEEALDITQETGNRLWERATILGNLGRAYSALGQIEKAIERYEEALVIFRKTGNRRQEGIQLGYLGNAYRTLGQVEQAIGYYEQSLSIARKIGDRRGEGDYLASLGSAYHSQGQFEQAIKLYQTSLVIAREIGNRGGEGFNLVSLGSTYRDLGQFEQSIKFYEEALAIARETGHRRGEGWDLGHLAIAYGALGQIEQAIQYYKEALAIVHEIGDRRGEGFHLGHLGRAYQALGQVEQAIEDYYKKALTIARETRDRRNEGIWLDHMGFAYCALRQFEQAIKLHKEAIAIACKIGNRLGKSYSLLGLGLALLAIGDLSQARQSCQKARDLNLPATSFRAALGLGIVFLHQHDAAAKETFADAASRCCAMLGKTAGLYEPCYVLAAALVGQAACDPHWAEGSKRDELLAPAMAEYRRALEICVAPGVVQDALRDLEMIRAAGIEGLEPVFGLLRDHVSKATDTNGDL